VGARRRCEVINQYARDIDYKVPIYSAAKRKDVQLEHPYNGYQERFLFDPENLFSVFRQVKNDKEAAAVGTSTSSTVALATSCRV
jgi:hypothetical protein